MRMTEPLTPSIDGRPAMYPLLPVSQVGDPFNSSAPSVKTRQDSGCFKVHVVPLSTCSNYQNN